MVWVLLCKVLEETKKKKNQIRGGEDDRKSDFHEESYIVGNFDGGRIKG